ncbi:MAG: MBL fold metallo-hydrolase [Candidatus Komeilibacteria bacterium]
MSIGIKKMIKYASLFALIIISLLFYYQLEQNDQVAKVVFFDVGQGDAILIITPTKKTILIDGGPDNAWLPQLGEQLPFYQRKIDLMILTHAHADHVVGLVEVLKRYQVDLILYPGSIEYYSTPYLEWLKLIEENSLNLQTTIQGDYYDFNDNSYLKTIYPFTEYTGQKVSDVNNTSVVNQYCYLAVCILLTGDLAAEGESEIIASKQNIQSAILKVEHHGSHYSSTDEFLEAINPQEAIIQVGLDNSFNHPHLRTLKKLTRMGIKIRRTDQDGMIIFYTDGQNYWFEPTLSDSPLSAIMDLIKK